MTVIGGAPASARSTPASARPELSRARYAIAALLPIVAILATLLWAGNVWNTGDARFFGMTQGNLPGSATVPNAAGGDWWVYSMAGTITDIHVTGSTGAIPVTMVGPTAIANYGGYRPHQVARFNVPMSGMGKPVQIEVTGSGLGFVAGQHDLVGFGRLDFWAMAALLVVNIGSSIAIILVPIIKRRRQGATDPAAL